jgi:hypothetical protein
LRVLDGEALPTPTRRGAAAADNGLGQSWPVLFIVALVLGGVLRQVLGRVPGALVVGGVLGVVAWFALGTLAVAATAGLTGFFVTLLGIGMGGHGGMHGHMKLQFLGATDTVTGSRYLLHQRPRHLLVDCGLFQGYKQLRLRNWAPAPVRGGRHRTRDPDARPHRPQRLPAAAGAPGFSGQGVLHGGHGYDLCRILLPDSGHLQEEEAEYANRHGFSAHARRCRCTPRRTPSAA